MLAAHDVSRQRPAMCLKDAPEHVAARATAAEADYRRAGNAERIASINADFGGKIAQVQGKVLDQIGTVRRSFMEQMTGARVDDPGAAKSGLSLRQMAVIRYTSWKGSEP